MTHEDDWYKDWKLPELKNGMNERGYWIDHVEGLTMEFGVDLSKFTYINAAHEVKLGFKCEIGQHCSILSHSSIGDKKGRVLIGEYTVIGSGTIIMPGVVIGDHCIIGANSYVDKDIVSYTKFVNGVMSNIK